MVREMVREMLEASGFTVFAAAGPKAAIGLFADKSLRIDLLVSDVVMPDMNGPELYEQLVMKIPGLKVIYISGYPLTTGKRGDSACRGAVVSAEALYCRSLAGEDPAGVVGVLS